MNIQWFPGHMAKTRRLLNENLKLIDVVIELLDARIPKSSKNPEIESIINKKPRVTVLNKADMADEKISLEWQRWFEQNGIKCVFIDSIKGTGINALKIMLREAAKHKIQKEKQRGKIFIPIRTMVVGIPNVGKSSFINKVAGRSSAATGDRPGVTRGKQWIRLNNEIELLDTPGILWPKFEDEETGLHLAWTGAIKDDILDKIELASLLMQKLLLLYPDELKARYKIDSSATFSTGYDILLAAGKNRGCIVSGGEVDLNRISSIVLDEFRGAKIGRITLERP